MSYNILSKLLIGAFYISHSYGLISCPQISHQALNLIHDQSKALAAKDSCLVGKNELKLGQLKKKYPLCFKKMQHLNAETKNYKFSAKPICKFARLHYHALQTKIEHYRAKQDICNLGKYIIELKSHINRNLRCLVQKHAKTLITDPTQNSDVEFR